MTRQNQPLSKNILAAFIGFLLLAGVLWLEPFKVTDPRSPAFNPAKFSFSDYKSRDAMRMAFKELFPVGTKEEEVDLVLINAGGAVKSVREGNNKILYARYTEPYRPWRQLKEASSHLFLFDSDHKLVNIHTFLGGKLYSEQPGWKENSGWSD